MAEQQLVEIARAFATGARVLVLDEPTSSLGRGDVQRLFELVRRLKADGHAVVYISHFIEEVKEVSDRFVVLRDGRNAGGGATATATREDIVSLMVGRRVEDLFPRSRAPGGRGDPGSRRPRARRHRLHAAPRRGAGHRGPDGGRAHASCCGRCSASSPCARAGSVSAPASGAASPPERWAQGMGLLSEDRKGEGLALGLPVADNLTLSRLDGLGPGPLVLPSRLDAVARRWIERLGVRAAGPRQPVRELSGGNQQKVALARLLHHDVDVLLLDEPTRGIDVGSKAQIYALVDALVAPPAARRAAKAVLVVSSDLAELLGVCDRIAVMCRGRLGPPRPAAEWDEHGLMMAATGSGIGRVKTRDLLARGGPLLGLLFVCAVFAFLIGPQFFRPVQPRADRPPDGDRLHGRARHDDRDRRRRHRPVGRIDHRPRHRGHRAAPSSRT